MYAFVVFVLLALTYRVLWGAVTELAGVELPERLAAVASVGVAAVLAHWAGYSVFEAFGTELGGEGMAAVATGAALVAGGEAFDRVTAMFHPGEQ